MAVFPAASAPASGMMVRIKGKFVAARIQTTRRASFCVRYSAPNPTDDPLLAAASYRWIRFLISAETSRDLLPDFRSDADAALDGHSSNRTLYSL